MIRIRIDCSVQYTIPYLAVVEEVDIVWDKDLYDPDPYKMQCTIYIPRCSERSGQCVG
jgi:hypothetical protein